MIKLQLGVRYSVGRVGQPTLKLVAGQGQPAVLFQAESAPEPLMMLPESFTEKSKIFFPSSGRLAGVVFFSWHWEFPGVCDTFFAVCRRVSFQQKMTLTCSSTSQSS